MEIRSFAAAKLGVLVAAALLIAGCAPVNSTPSETQLLDDFSAELSTEVVLTVGTQDFSLEDLAARPVSSLSILEPFSKEETEFTVISFGDLMLDAGLSETDTVETIALNDYRFSDTLEAFAANNAYLAILENGKEIPVSSGGPVRIVFDEDSPYYQNLDAWNWSLRTIESSGE